MSRSGSLWDHCCLVVFPCGLLLDCCGLWVVVDHCSLLWGLCGWLHVNRCGVVVAHCGSLWLVPCFSNYEWTLL